MLRDPRAGASDSTQLRWVAADAAGVADVLNSLSGTVIGACIEVHRHLGPGLLEKVYVESVVHERGLRGVRCESQVTIPTTYKGIALSVGYRMDVVVERQIILEVKAVETVLPVHVSQVITYLRLTGLPLALLVNFHVPALRGHIRRFVNRAPDLRTVRDPALPG